MRTVLGGKKSFKSKHLRRCDALHPFHFRFHFYFSSETGIGYDTLFDGRRDSSFGIIIFSKKEEKEKKVHSRLNFPTGPFHVNRWWFVDLQTLPFVFTAGARGRKED